MLVTVLVSVVVVTVFVVAGILLRPQNPNVAYKTQWTKTMTAFQAQINKDDAKANALAKKNDAAGLFKLVKTRIDNVKYRDIQRGAEPGNQSTEANGTE